MVESVGSSFVPSSVSLYVEVLKMGVVADPSTSIIPECTALVAKSPMLIVSSHAPRQAPSKMKYVSLERRLIIERSARVHGND